jgi:hypothetical protein
MVEFIAPDDNVLLHFKQKCAIPDDKIYCTLKTNTAKD